MISRTRSCEQKLGAMGLPTDSLGIVTLIILALPGLIYAATRRWARGEVAGDRDLGLGIARGTVFAVALTSVYLLLLGPRLFSGLAASSDNEVAIVDARLVALKTLGLYIVVPAAISLLANAKHLDWSLKSTPKSKHGYTSTPTPWDDLVGTKQNAWVKIQRANGDWVGGWYSGGSVASTYPEPPSIYIADQFEMTDDGNFLEPVGEGTGVFVSLSDGDVVIWSKQTDPKVEGN